MNQWNVDVAMNSRVERYSHLAEKFSDVLRALWEIEKLDISSMEESDRFEFRVSVYKV